MKSRRWWQSAHALIVPDRANHWTRWRPKASVEGLVFGVCVYLAVVGNTAFLSASTSGRSWANPETWIFAGALVTSLIALHAFIVGLLANRWTVRPMLTLLVLATAFATFFMQRYGVYYDPTMLRNVLRTDTVEAGELMTASLLLHVLAFSLLPVIAIWRVHVVAKALGRAMLRRSLFILASAAVLVVSLLLVFQDFSALMRNQKELRYLITPANLLYSTARVLSTDAETATVRTPVGTDARMAPAAQGRKPTLMFVVVGETLRAASWGLNGYARQTAPQMQALGVLNFSNVTACGTNTETSLPCMFSAVGRRDYDETRIRSSESLLHVLARAGVAVYWKDNQSGCKGVCDGLGEIIVDPKADTTLCADGRCFDEVLLHNLDRLTPGATGDTVVVLHMLGNHGPAYYKRYPAAFRRFQPTCDTGELRRCDRQSIVNAYDNAVLYTDHVLSQAVAYLKAQEERFDTAMLYVSDHGESLGEKGLFLHGLPQAIAPNEQTRVPMVWWLSESFKASRMLDAGCLHAKTALALSHDNLFHSVLGLMAITTRAYDARLDIAAACTRLPGATPTR